MTETDTKPRLTDEQVRAIWTEYERTHDLTALRGQVGAIDLETGEVYIGASRQEIDARHRAAGRHPRSMFLTRIGWGYYMAHNPRRKWSPPDPAVEAELQRVVEQLKLRFGQSPE